MNNFFHNLINGNTIVPPEIVEKSLNENFSKPLNIEWFTRDNHYEAVFYNDNLEYIARFKPDGLMVEYKINLPVGSLPENIIRTTESKGEIMNVLAIHTGEKVGYEVIYRNKELKRFLMLINRDGVIGFEKPL